MDKSKSMDTSQPTDTSEQRGRQISREAAAFFKKLGQRIARIRQAKGMSQAQLGQIVGVSEEQVAEVEAGIRRPPLSVMPALAACLGIAISDLVDVKQLGLSPKVQQHIETLKRLSKADQKFVMNVAETLAQSSRTAISFAYRQSGRREAEIKQIAPPPGSDTND